MLKFKDECRDCEHRWTCDDAHEPMPECYRPKAPDLVPYYPMPYYPNYPIWSDGTGDYHWTDRTDTFSTITGGTA